MQVQREGKLLGSMQVGLRQAHQRCIVGRDPTPGACDLVLEHASVSRRHAHLTAEPTGTVSLTDLGSGEPALLGLQRGSVVSTGVGRRLGVCVCGGGVGQRTCTCALELARRLR